MGLFGLCLKGVVGPTVTPLSLDLSLLMGEMSAQVKFKSIQQPQCERPWAGRFGELVPNLKELIG